MVKIDSLLSAAPIYFFYFIFFAQREFVCGKEGESRSTDIRRKKKIINIPLIEILE